MNPGNMCIADRYKRCLLFMCCMLLPLLLPAQELDTATINDLNASIDSAEMAAQVYADSMESVKYAAQEEQQEVKTHYLWDRVAPVNIDSTEEWWASGGLVERKVPVAVLTKLKADKKLQYDQQGKKQQNNKWLMMVLMGLITFLQSIRLFIYILLIAGLVALIIYFMRQQGFRFSKKMEPDMPGVEEADPGPAGYEKQVQEAIAGRRFRLAVRFLHLQTLRLLAERQLITLSKDKTNADYLRVLLQTQWYQPFARLTRDYEYIWYGETTVNAEQFDRIHGQFRQFINELGYTR